MVPTVAWPSVVVFKFILLQTLPTRSMVLHMQSPPTNPGFPSAVYLATDFCSVVFISFRRHIYILIDGTPAKTCEFFCAAKCFHVMKTPPARSDYRFPLTGAESCRLGKSAGVRLVCCYDVPNLIFILMH